MANRSGMTLVVLLVVIVIIALVVGVYMGLFRGSSEGKEQKTTPGAALDKAHGIECAQRLNQLRMQLKMDSMDLGHYPRQLDPNSSLTRCPVSGKMYGYDPRTGRIWCTTPGHGDF